MRASWIVPFALAAVVPCAARADDAGSLRREIMRRLTVGRVALEQGDAQAAARDLCWASRRALNSHDAAWFCGRALLAARRPEDAVKALEIAADIDPRHLGSWVDLGDAFLAVGSPDKARPAYYKALELRKDHSPAFDGLARLAQRTGDERGALELFAKALDANPADARARLHRGQLHLAAGRLAQAIEDIAEAARLRPDDAEVQLGLGRVELRARRSDEALRAARAAKRIVPKDARPDALTAEVYVALEAYPEAEEAARAALARDPFEARARLALAESLGRRGRVGEALETLAIPAAGPYERHELAEFDEARRRWTARRDELARLEGEATKPDAAPDSLLALAAARAVVGDDAAAAALALRAAEATDDAAALRRAARALGAAGRPFAGARTMARVEAKGAMTGADWVDYGVMRELSGEPSRAADCYARALAAGGPVVEAQAGLARLALARGDLSAARAAVEALLAANPPADVAERARAALARLGTPK